MVNMEDCIFCRIVAKRLPAKFEFENDQLVAIQDINAQAPTHLLVIPKKHISRLDEVQESDHGLLGDLVLCAKNLACQRQLQEGFRLVLNNGPQAGQSVFHIHVHVLGGRAMRWPPG